MPPESASPPRSIWSSAHIAPTVGHVTLPARRPLRDGTDSTVSRGSSASRPAPGLLGKRGRSDRSGSSKSDKSSEGVKSRYSPDTVAHMPPVSGQQVTGAEASRRLPRLQTRKSLVQSSDDESLTDLSDGEGEGSPRNSSGGVVTDHTPVNGVPRTTQSPTLIQSGSSSDDSGPRFTAAQKGKGRAATTPSPQVFGSDSDVNDGLDAAMDESIQFISSAPAREVVEVIEETNGVIEEDSALSAFMCPVCFCAPTNPAFTPCGHVLCYACLHSSLLAAIQRQPNPFPQVGGRQTSRGRGGRGRGRGRGRGGINGASSQRVYPTQWSEAELREAWTEHRSNRLILEQAANAPENRLAMAAAAALEEFQPTDVHVQHPLQGVWQVEDKWIIEGECPVCREGIPGGLGPLGSGLGGVNIIETRVIRA